MAFAEVNGARIHYREAGSGEAVVLLHALPLHSGMWQGQLDALGQRWRVVAPDFRGFGQTGDVPAVSRIGLLAEDVIGLLDALGIRRAVFGGISMGNYVSFEIWRRWPERVRALALCDTRANIDSPEVAANREKTAQSALAKGIGWVADESGPGLMRPAPDPEVARTVRQLILENSAEGVAAMHRGLAERPDSTDTLPRITCPTLVVVGEEDRISPLPVAEQMAKTIPGARLVRIPAAGHVSNLENRAAFDSALMAFLEELPG
jgi:pimeloyl-ACP methyl ester carboxylesterase